MIEDLIKTKSGSIELNDMIPILNDTVDVYALEKINLLSKIFKEWKIEFWEELNLLESWDGWFDLGLTAPTLFTLFEYKISHNLFIDLIPDKDAWIWLLSSYRSEDFIMTFLSHLSED